MNVKNAASTSSDDGRNKKQSPSQSPSSGKGNKDGSAVVDVRDLSVMFKIPHMKNTTVMDRFSRMVRGGRCSFEELWALRNVSFKVERGETLGIVGPNGSGKSTLLEVIAGIQTPTKGEVTVKGGTVPFLGLGVGFQHELTATENVILNGVLLGIPVEEARAQVDEVIEFAGLHRFRDTKLKNFSTGMQMRLAFSSAIQARPDIMLIDEVFAVGDENFRKKCIRWLVDYKNSGKTIIFVSHSLPTMTRICDRVLYLKSGRAVCVEDPHKAIQTYLEDLDPEVQTLKGALKRNGPGDSDGMDLERVKSYWLKNDFGPMLGQSGHLPRCGRGRISIESVRMFNTDGEEGYRFSPHEGTSVELKIRVRGDLKRFILIARIDSSEGELFFQGKPMIVDNFKGPQLSIRLDIRALPLSMGDYNLNLVAASDLDMESLNIVIEDSHVGMHGFQIKRDPLSSILGHTQLDHRWSGGGGLDITPGKKS